MINEKYFEKMEAQHIKYGEYTDNSDYIRELMILTREIAKYTDDERNVTRIMNSLIRKRICSISDLMKADIDDIAKIRNVGFDALNIIRQIKGLPIVAEEDRYPFSTTYMVYFSNLEKGESHHTRFNTLKQLSDYMNSEEAAGEVITYISVKGE